MQIIDISKQTPGATFPETLFHITGRELLPANTELTREHLDALIKTGVTQVFMAENVQTVLAFAKTPQATLATEALAVGTAAQADLLTPDGVLMIQHGEQIEEHHVAALRDSRIDYLIQRPQADMEAVRAALHDVSRVAAHRIDEQIKRGEYLRATESGDALKNAIPAASDDILALNAINLLRRRLSTRLRPFYGLIQTGKTASIETLEEIANDLIDLMKGEPRQFSQLALMTARREDHVPDHALSVAVLGMAIATQLGFSLHHVKEVVIASLLFDVGMLLLPKRIREGSGALVPSDRERIHEHPLLSVSMMEQIPNLGPIPRIAAYQHHERLNGTGYPLGATAGQISDYSQIVAVADVYAASTNPRTYKPQKLPYTAMEELVLMAHRGLIDARIVKALLSAIGLFPVGSCVKLSDGTTAQVVGANNSRIDRPLLARLDGDGAQSEALFDLSAAEFADIKIVKAIPMPSHIAEQQGAV